jgi:hypothetical protein
MAYDEAVAARVRARIGDHPALAEKRMFGGIAFLVAGNMAVGVSGMELMVRVGAEAHEAALARRGARAFDMTGRPMAGWVVVAPGGFSDEADFGDWVDEGVRYAESLPPK